MKYTDIGYKFPEERFMAIQSLHKKVGLIYYKLFSLSKKD